MILRQVLGLVVTGIAIGVPVSLAVTRLVAGLLFGLSVNDPSALTAAAILLLLIGMPAGYLPARRATQVNPMVALRHE